MFLASLICHFVPPSSTCYVSAVTAMMFRGIQSASWLIYVESWSLKLFWTALACKVRTHSTFHSWIACPMQQHPSLLNADPERCLRYKCRECVHFISSSRPLVPVRSLPDEFANLARDGARSRSTLRPVASLAPLPIVAIELVWIGSTPLLSQHPNHPE